MPEFTAEHIENLQNGATPRAKRGRGKASKTVDTQKAVEDTNESIARIEGMGDRTLELVNQYLTQKLEARQQAVKQAGRAIAYLNNPVAFIAEAVEIAVDILSEEVTEATTVEALLKDDCYQKGAIALEQAIDSHYFVPSSIGTLPIC